MKKLFYILVGVTLIGGISFAFSQGNFLKGHIEMTQNLGIVTDTININLYSSLLFLFVKRWEKGEDFLVVPR